MDYQRLAKPEAATAIAPVWRDFAQRRSQADPSMNLKPDFDYQRSLEGKPVFKSV